MLRGLIDTFFRRNDRSPSAPGVLGRPAGTPTPASMPSLDTPLDAAEFLAIDLETSGLDLETDEILSVGYVPIVGAAVRLDQAAYFLVRPARPVPERTAVIHGLLDDRLETAPPLEQVLPHVLQALSGRIAIAHYSRIERGFLAAACTARHLAVPKFRFIDTLAIERRSLIRRGKVIAEGDLRLSAVRARYGLPRYRAHNALVDAVAAAELFLAQAAHAAGRRKPRIADFMT